LDVTSGHIDIYFLSDPKQDGAGVNLVYLELFNPKYHDQKAADIVVNLSNYDTNKHEWRA
jgi:hypothetical protein